MALRDPVFSVDAATTPASARFSNYMLGVLLLIYVFNGVDRSLMWVLLEPIKNELDLTDSQLGWLSGFAFGVCYALAGVPIGMLADRAERRRIISLAVAVWSVMTASCGLTTGFWALFGTRVAVGTAEAGGPPASISFLSDLYPERSRGTVVAIYMSGSSIALVLTYALGSWIGARIGWRMTFMVAAIPGLILAGLVWWTFVEPRRAGGGASVRLEPAATFGVTLRHLMSLVSIRWLFIGLMISSITTVGISTFMTSFLMRTHHLPLTRAGGLIALSHTFAALCMPTIGRLSDSLKARDLRWSMWLPAIVIASGLPFALTVMLADSMLPIYLLLPLLSAVGGSQIGPLYAYMQSTVHVRMRATTLSIAYAVQNLIGIGLGALIVGSLSDALKPKFGIDSLRYAMASTAVLFILASLCYMRSAAGIRIDRARLRLSPAEAAEPFTSGVTP